MGSGHSQQLAEGLSIDDKRFRKAVAKAEAALLSELQDGETVYAVAPQVAGGVVVVTDRRVLATNGNRISYVCEKSRIGAVSIASRQVSYKPYVQFFVWVEWTGGPLRARDSDFYSTIGHFSIDCGGDQEAQQRVAAAAQTALLD